MDGTRTESGEAAAWASLPVAEVIARLGTDPANGLSRAEADRRLAEHGPNALGVDEGPGRLAIFVDQFRNVLIWILVVAAVVSGAVLQEWIDFGVIMAIVVLNAVLGYVQDARAESALGRLEELTAPEAVLLRDGRETVVAAAVIVPGDVVVLAAGDRIPADGRVVEAVHLEVEEAALTGESFPVTKGVEPAAPGAALGDQTSMVFAGTAAAGGRGRVVVTATGPATQMGQIAELLSEDEPPTPLTVELDRVGKRLAILALATAVIIFLTGLTRGSELESMFLIAVALAVAAIPEGLPAVVTITLARGVQRMAERNAIVRRLPAVEALGSATVVCTDKTGTLTRNELEVQELRLPGLTASLEEAPAGDSRVRRYATVAAVSNDSRPDGEGGYLGDPTEVALLRSVERLGLDPAELRRALPRLDEVAFDSRRKRMATLHPGEEGSVVLFVKGAPEVVVTRCGRRLGEDGVEAFGDAGQEAVLAAAEDMARRGLRTLAFAYRELPAVPGDLAAAEEDLVLVGLAGMSDAVRAEAAHATAEARRAGIAVVMVTGDHLVTARAVAEEVGILGDGRDVMSGEDLARIDEAELERDVADHGVYARVDPVDKVKIVHAWQARGDIVAMTGDGVNDAPALKAADIGVAMGSGTDVAKDSSSMVLADDDFASIIAAVREGRGIFANLKKVVYFLLSANASEVLVMFVGFLAFGYLGEPLLAVQLLWINLVTDGLPALALGMDPTDPGVMDRPPDLDRNILSGSHLLRLLAFGAVLAAATLAAVPIGYYLLDREWAQVRTAMFTILVLTQLAHAFNIRSPERSVWRHGFVGNPMLLVASLGSLGLHLAVVYTPLGQTLFRTEPLVAGDWTWIIALTLASFVVVDGLEKPLNAWQRRRVAATALRG